MLRNVNKEKRTNKRTNNNTLQEFFNWQTECLRIFSCVYLFVCLVLFFSSCSPRKVIWIANGQKSIIYYFSKWKKKKWKTRDDGKKVCITESKANKIRCAEIFFALREKCEQKKSAIEPKRFRVGLKLCASVCGVFEWASEWTNVSIFWCVCACSWLTLRDSICIKG